MSNRRFTENSVFSHAKVNKGVHSLRRTVAGLVGVLAMLQLIPKARTTASEIADCSFLVGVTVNSLNQNKFVIEWEAEAGGGGGGLMVSVLVLRSNGPVFYP